MNDKEIVLEITVGANTYELNENQIKDFIVMITNDKKELQEKLNKIKKYCEFYKPLVYTDSILKIIEGNEDKWVSIKMN